MDAGLEIIPVLNKIDLPGAEPERRAQEIIDLIGVRAGRDPGGLAPRRAPASPSCSRRSSHGCRRRAARQTAPLRALIFDSYYDRYRGAIPSVRVVDGVVAQGMEISFGAHPDDVYDVDEVGYLQLGQRAGARARGRRGRLRRGQPARRARRAGGRHHPRRARPRRRAAARLPGSASRWSSPASTRPTPTSTRGCATRWRSCSSTTPACNTSRRRPPRSASASAADSSACCTWRSCRSGSSASSTST